MSFGGGKILERRKSAWIEYPPSFLLSCLPGFVGVLLGVACYSGSLLSLQGSSQAPKAKPG